MTRKDKTKPRFSVGLTPDQVSRLDEIQHTRSRKGETTNRSALVREAVGFYCNISLIWWGRARQLPKTSKAKSTPLTRKLRICGHSSRCLSRV